MENNKDPFTTLDVVMIFAGGFLGGGLSTWLYDRSLKTVMLGALTFPAELQAIVIFAVLFSAPLAITMAIELFTGRSSSPG